MCWTPLVLFGQAAAPVRLSLTDAEQIALRNNPNISVARLLALESREQTRQARSALLPLAYSNLTAVGAEAGSRIAAGGLNSPVLYSRSAYGVTVTQLITDFGQTQNIVASAKLRSQAEEQTMHATVNQIKLAVDREFYRSLSAQAVVDVARQTVASRKMLADQVAALARNKLKSDLDLSFANTNLEEARLLQLDAQNQFALTVANLSELLGYQKPPQISLIDDPNAKPSPPAEITSLLATAMAQRPEIHAEELLVRSAEKLQSAAREQYLPSIRAMGLVGQAPVRDEHIPSWYGAAGINIEVPIFNGFRIQSQVREAKLRDEAERERLVGLQNLISRDVRQSWLEEKTAYQRLGVTAALLQQAKLGLDLAQTRYKIGLGSIVEVSQAQLQATQAEIAKARARYDCLLAEAITRFTTGTIN